jgi:hypothetical protein
VRTHSIDGAPLRAWTCATLALAAFLSLTVPVGAADTPKKPAAGMIEGNPAEIPQAPVAPGTIETQGLDRSTQGLVKVRHADGSSSVRLQGSFRAYSVVTFGADGSAWYHCVDSAAAAIALCERGAAGVPDTHGFGGPRCPVGPREE